jgi:twinkle protein
MVAQHGLRVGNIFLEEGYRKTAQGYVAIHNNVPLGNLRYNPSLIDQATYQRTLDVVIRGRMYFYNHFGSLESENLVRKLRYMAVGLGCDFIVLDHISMVVSGQEGTGQGERKDIDVLMTELRSLVENTGVGVMAIVHLKQPEGKAHEEGGQVSLSQLRGSGSLKQIPDSVVALERDQQAADPNTAHIRLLKNREFGVTGICGQVAYDPETGRLNHCESSESYESAGFEDESSGEDAYSTTDF